MMKGITKSGAAIALLATTAKAAEEVAQQAPEAAKQILTNDNAVGLLASALDMVSHCPSFVTQTLDTVAGENPYVRGAAVLTTAAIGLGTAYLAFSSCGKKKKPASPISRALNESSESVSNPDLINPAISPDESPAAAAAVGEQPTSAGSASDPLNAEGEVSETKARSRSPSPTRRND